MFFFYFRYNPGACAIRWAIPLAAIAALDAITLAALAFILASRHVRLQPEPFNNGSLYKGFILISKYLKKKQLIIIIVVVLLLYSYLRVLYTGLFNFININYLNLILGEVNPGYVNEASVAGSRKSLSLRPVLLVGPPEQDRYSELSRAKSHSHHSLYSPGPHAVHTLSTNTLNHSQRNFQL